MKLKNVAVMGLVLAGAVGAVISFLVFADIINGDDGDDYFDDSVPGTCPVACGNDVFRTRGGDDTIISTNGNDRIDAGDDDDQIEIGPGAGRAYVVGGEGNDIIDASAGSNHRIFGNDGDDNILIGDAVLGARVDAGDGDDVIDITSAGMGPTGRANVVVYGGFGDDEIEALDCGTGGEETTCNLKIFGGPGQDNITLGRGSSFVEPGEDADVVVAGTSDDSQDIINIRVGDVPAGETEKITCTVDPSAQTRVILKRNALGAFPRGTPTTFGASGVLTIIDPLTGGVYEIRKGDGECMVVRR